MDRSVGTRGIRIECNDAIRLARGADLAPRKRDLEPAQVDPFQLDRTGGDRQPTALVVDLQSAKLFLNDDQIEQINGYFERLANGEEKAA